LGLVKLIDIYRLNQTAGTYAMTGPGVLHQGFNSGENIAQEVNFAVIDWLQILPHVHPCNWVSFNVRLSVTEIFRTFMEQQKQVIDRKGL